jgi:hypothetical protein
MGMNQAEEQFAQQPAEAESTEAQAEKPVEQETEATNEAPAAESKPQEQESAPEPPDYSKLGSMNQSDQLSFLKRHGFVETNAEPKEEKPAEAKEDKQQDAQGEEHQAPEQTYEIKVNGETRKVTMKELTDLAQMGADYTKKTQALAESRRQVDAMMAALQVQKASQPQQTQPQPQDNPVDRVKSDYEQAVRETEQRLRLKPGEFNQFDPMHQFALHRVMSEHEAQQARYAARMSDVQTEIQDFLAEANKDPDTQAINDNFNRYLFAMGASSAEGAEKAQRIANAENALFSKTATREDCKVLRAHWKYVKEQLAKEKAAQQAQAAPKPEPPKTETPGNGRQAQTHAVFDMHKLGSMNTQQQLRALKQLGIFNMKG